MRRQGIRTPLPAVTFGNVQSIGNKGDELAINCKYIRDYRESGFIAITESWLQGLLVRRNRKDTRTQRGGGIAVYVHERVEYARTFLL